MGLGVAFVGELLAVLARLALVAGEELHLVAAETGHALHVVKGLIVQSAIATPLRKLSVEEICRAVLPPRPTLESPAFCSVVWSVEILDGVTDSRQEAIRAKFFVLALVA